MAAATVHQANENTSTQLASQDVGLIFVREYYTFLNKKPYRLHAFYNKDSLFIRGDEGTVSTTVKGQEEIRKKIEECKFEDCKVLVTQVDSQVSANDGILIQVLGEMCNHDGPSQKFSQTFFLATQPNGYYVLNDIFRFLKDEVEIDYYTCEQQQQQQAVPEPVLSGTPVVNHATAPIVEAPVPVPSPAPAPAAVAAAAVSAGVPSPVIAQAQVQAPLVPVKPEIKKEEKKKVVEEEVVKKEEQAIVPDMKKVEPVQKEPETEEKKKTKSDKQQQKAEPKQQKQQQQQQQQQAEKPATPVKPSAPKSWAKLAAPTNGTLVSAEKSPIVSNATAIVNATPASAPAAASAVVPPAAAAVTSNEKQANPNQQRQQQQNKNQNARPEATNIFVKLVNEQISEEQLLEAFTKIGAVKSSNISRQRNCAFIEFVSPESCQKALAQHRVQVGSYTVLAEERRYNHPSNQNQNSQRYNSNQNRSSQSFDQRRSNSNSNQNRRNNQSQQNQGGSSNRQNSQAGKGRGAPAVK